MYFTATKSKFLIALLCITSIIYCKDSIEFKKAKPQKKEIESGSQNKIQQLEKAIEKKKKEISALEEELKNLKKQIKPKAIAATDVFYDLGSGTGKVTVHALLYDPKDPQKAKDILADYYKDIRGEIPDPEREMITRKKGSPVYGEILPDSFQQILEDKDLNIKPFKKVVGIELSPTRHHHAVTIQSKLKENNQIPCEKVFELKNENITEADMNDADVIFTCSTCFPDVLMEELVEKLSKLKDGLLILSLKELPEPEKFGFTKLKELKLPMTWSSGSPVHIYRLNKSNKKKIKTQETKTEEKSEE